jgi:hypothetical protein
LSRMFSFIPVMDDNNHLVSNEMFQCKELWLQPAMMAAVIFVASAHVSDERTLGGSRAMPDRGVE